MKKIESSEVVGVANVQVTNSIKGNPIRLDYLRVNETVIRNVDLLITKLEGLNTKFITINFDDKKLFENDFNGLSTNQVGKLIERTTSGCLSFMRKPEEDYQLVFFNNEYE